MSLCVFCNGKTVAESRLCDNCWEVSRRVRSMPIDVLEKILAEERSESIVQIFTVSNNTESGWCIRVCDRYQDKLGADEVLYLIATLLINPDRKPPYGGLLTREEHEERDRKMFGHKEPLKPWEKQLSKGDYGSKEN